MVVEWLRFRVRRGMRARFIAEDRRVWTAALSPFPGFVRRSVWAGPRDESEVVTVIEWASREDWRRVPRALLAVLERRFAGAVGRGSYRQAEARAYRVCDR